MNKLFYYSLVLFLVTLMATSCSEDEPTMVNEPVDPVPVVPVDTSTTTDELQYLTLDSDYIFDDDKLPTFELTIPEENYSYINSDPTAEEYVEGSLTFEGETVGPIGVRYKGSIGAFVGCVSGADWTNPSGSKTCTKLSMKIKMNWLDGDDKFYGLKKLQFHSMNLDDSQMRERMGYYLFREMGIAAPRCVHARLFINGEYNGLFALVEQIDGRFTRENFDNGKGNLYKEIWPLKSNGQANSEAAFIDALETNEDENPTAAIIREFAEELSVAPEAEVRQLVESKMSIEEILSYAVVDRTIRVDDGAFHWYCDGNDCSNHNYYWYEDPSEERLHLIPWDMDNTFENIITDQNPVTPIKDEWGDITNNCAPFPYGLFSAIQKSATCDKLTAAWVSYEDLYQQKLVEFKTGPLSAANINEKMTKWTDQIRSATEQATFIHGDAVSMSRWESRVEELSGQLKC